MLPEENPYLDTMIRVIEVLNTEQPDAVISHEEFSVLPAAKIFDLRALFIIDWFPLHGTIWMDSLAYSESIMFLDQPGYFDEPRGLKGKIEYVGPVIRPIKPCRDDRQRFREELQLPSDQPVILVLPGGSSASSEEKT